MKESLARLMRPGLVMALAMALSACASSPPQARRTAGDTARGDAATTNIQLAVGYLEQGRTELALEKIQRALDRNDNSAQAHTVAGVIYERIGDINRAAYHYRKAVDIDGDTGQMLNNYGAFLCKHDEYEKGVEYLERAVQDPFYNTPAAAMTNAGHCAQRLGQDERAQAFYQRALELDARYPDALFRMSRLLYCRNEAFRARAFLQRYESVAPVSLETLVLGTAIENSLGNAEGVAAYKLQLDRLYPNSDQTQSARKRICT